MNDFKVWYIVAIIALVTAAIRFLPFIVFKDGKQTPKIIEKLSKALPYAIMGMLVVYCMKEMNFASVEGYLPMIISGMLVGIFYVWKRNTLISIVIGTVCYMFLIQVVF